MYLNSNFSGDSMGVYPVGPYTNKTFSGYKTSGNIYLT